MPDPSSILDKSELLSSFPQAYKDQLAKHLKRIEFGRGETIFEEGDPGDALYLIEHGAVGVYAADSSMGFNFEIARLEEGDCFGEMALLTEEPRSATCRTIEPCVVYMLTSQVFNTLLNGAPQMSAALCKVLARRVQALNKSQGLQFKSLANCKFDQEAYNLVPETILNQYKLVPIHFAEGILTMATTNPQNAMGMDAVRRVVRGVEIKPVLISEEDYKKFTRDIKSQTRPGPAATGFYKRAMNIQYYAETDDKDDKLRSAAPGEDAVSTVSAILSEAVNLEASDIHVEPEREGTVVRYRIEGRLKKRDSLIARALHRGIISRLKVLAALDISEKRLAQDGRFSINAEGRDLDVRISTMPTKHGEKAVLRVLDSANALIELQRVILADKIYQAVRKMLMQPHGVILITGPTGSGKTTTMYSMLMERKSPEINIVTVEDPIEYAIPGITQTQVIPGIGLDFSDVLRTFLRQDTDIILIGEMRDSKTAHMALEAGLTGKLVLTSFHTNDTIGAIVRLREMGCDPFTVSNSLSGVICQRLLRRLCPACAEPFVYPEPVTRSLIQAGVCTAEAIPQMFRPKGCPACGNTGFKGRVSALELLVMNEPVRQMISANASPVAIAKVAADKGAQVSLARYCSFLLANKITVPGEALRVLPREEDLTWKST
jgi:type IV pilus assembly protein PilB